MNAPLPSHRFEPELSNRLLAELKHGSGFGHATESSADTAPKARRQGFRDLDAERAEARAHSDARALSLPLPAALRLACMGLAASELRLLHELVAQSQCQTPRLSLVSALQAHAADVLLIAAGDPTTRAWIKQQGDWLQRRAVVWIDGLSASPGHQGLARPFSGHTLMPVMMAAWFSTPRVTQALAQRQLQPQAPVVLVMASASGSRQRWGHQLEAIGHRSTLAGTAREGLAALHATHHCAAVLDQGVPDIDNASLARRVRALDRRLGRTPLICVDSSPNLLSRWRSRMAGFDDTVSQAPMGAELLSLLNRVAALSAKAVNPVGQAVDTEDSELPE